MLTIALTITVLTALVALCYWGGRLVDRVEARRSLGRGTDEGWVPSPADLRVLRRARRELELSRRS